MSVNWFDQAEQNDGLADDEENSPAVYTVPVNPADETNCEACE